MNSLREDGELAIAVRAHSAGTSTFDSHFMQPKRRCSATDGAFEANAHVQSNIIVLKHATGLVFTKLY